jgi:threonine dehydrogenase-like Zn-dependent dehydrogenase
MKARNPAVRRRAAPGRADLPAVVSHRFPLVQAQDAFGVAARRTGLKVIVEPGS